MRLALFLLALAPLLVSAQPQTQPQTASGTQSLERMDRVRLSEDQQSVVARDAGLRAMLGVQAGAATARRGYTLFATGDDCSARGAICAVAAGRSPIVSLTLPFARAGGLGSTRVQTLHRVDGVQLSERQIASVLENPDRKDNLRLDDEGRLWSEGGASIVATDASAEDCGHPRVQCGVVFEIETTLHILMIGE